MNDYGPSKSKGDRYILIVIDNFSQFGCRIPLKSKYIRNMIEEISESIRKSKRKPNERLSDGRQKFVTKLFQTFSKLSTIHQFSRFFD